MKPAQTSETYELPGGVLMTKTKDAGGALIRLAYEFRDVVLDGNPFRLDYEGSQLGAWIEAQGLAVRAWKRGQR